MNGWKLALLFLILIIPVLAIDLSKPDIYEPDGSFESSTYLEANWTRQLHSFHSSGDHDYINFTAIEGSMYVIETFNRSDIDLADTIVYLYDKNGDLITFNDDIIYGQIKNSRISWTATSNGTYFLRIIEFSNNSLGSYEIAIARLGKLEPFLVEPANSEKQLYSLFNFTAGVKCADGYCLNISASLSLAAGLITAIEGAKPFYTLSDNPQKYGCLEYFREGETCNQSWIVNATGEINSTWELFAVYESNYSSNATASVNITINTLSVSLDSPKNNSYVHLPITLNCSAHSPNNLSNLSLYLGNETFIAKNQTYAISGTSDSKSFNIALPEGNYTWDCLGSDILNKQSFAAGKSHFIADNTVPLLGLSINDSTLEFGLDSILIIWDAADANLNASYANVSYPNGTILAQFTARNFNIEPNNLTLLGNYNVTAYAIDNAGNNNITSILFNVVDTIAPSSISLSAPDEGYSSTSTTVEFNFSATDNQDNSLSCNISIDSQTAISTDAENGTFKMVSASVNAGSHQWNVTCSDNAFNRNSSITRNFTINQALGQGSNGGDRGGGNAGGNSGGANHRVTLPALNDTKQSKRVDASLENGNTPFTNAVLELANGGIQASITVKALAQLPSGIANLEKTIYKIVEAETNLQGPDISSLIIKFKVENSWLKSNNIANDNIALYRFNFGWNALETKFTGEDEAYSYYAAESPGFSYFAIASKNEVSNVNNTEFIPTVTGAATGGIAIREHWKGILLSSAIIIALFLAVIYFKISRRKFRYYVPK